MIDSIYDALQSISDPEIPVLNVLELGMITDVKLESKKISIKMIPTYAACPATAFIRKYIESELTKHFPEAEILVEVDLKTHWDTNRISEIGKEKLKQFGIAPPKKHNGIVDNELILNIECPFCKSTDTVLRTPFGSTLCRAIQFCKNCNQSFEQFKPFAVE